MSVMSLFADLWGNLNDFFSATFSFMCVASVSVGEIPFSVKVNQNMEVETI